MQISPRIYHSIIRPKWMTNIYIHNKVRQHFDFSDKSVLDFGAGTGANCTLCSPDHYLGIDPDSQRIDFARRMYNDYRFMAYTGNELPVADNSFDFILIVAVLHHIHPEKIPCYIKEFRRILKPQGRIIVIEPCYFDRSPLSNWFMNYYDKGDYIQNEKDYLHYFTNQDFNCHVIKNLKNAFFIMNCILLHFFSFSTMFRDLSPFINQY